MAGARRLVIADNADSRPDYLARMRSPTHGSMLVQFIGDVGLSMRTADADYAYPAR